jgi:hypothetical protein
VLPGWNVCPGRRLPTVKKYLHTVLEQAAIKRAPGYLDEVRSRAVEITEKFVIVSDEAHAELAAKYSPAEGPGTELKRLLSLIGITAGENCSCNKHARIMNAWGADECERRVEEIVGWLREEATKRGLPFFAAAGRMVVRRAIAAARRSAVVDLTDTVASGERHDEAKAGESLLHGR